MMTSSIRQDMSHSWLLRKRNHARKKREEKQTFKNGRTETVKLMLNWWTNFLFLPSTSTTSMARRGAVNKILNGTRASTSASMIRRFLAVTAAHSAGRLTESIRSRRASWRNQWMLKQSANHNVLRHAKHPVYPKRRLFHCHLMGHQLSWAL